MDLRIIYRITIFVLFFYHASSLGQQDTTITLETPTGISDSLITTDSTKTLKSQKKFFAQFEEEKNTDRKSTYSISKKEIDFTDYRYAGNIIDYLPFGKLRNLGSLGTPSEPNLFGFGYGNFSLILDDNDESNSWNYSTDLNRIQTEGIQNFSVVPLHKAFLHGFNNNPATILISTNDTIKRKPISRIRYYQSPNEEGFIDAFFSARVLSRLALSIRVTNNSIDSLYGNTEYGSWKLNLKAIYKLGDSLYSSLSLSHRKLNTPLNGGIDIESLVENIPSQIDLYSTTNPVVNNNMQNESILNSFSGRIYGNILPWGLTSISMTYHENEDILRYLSDSSLVKEKNYYKIWRSLLNNKNTYNDLTISVNGGYEFIDYKLGSINDEKDLHNYFSSISLSLNSFNDIFIPSLFGKYSKYNDQNSSGFGGEIISYFTDKLKLVLGYSNFSKPYSLAETEYIDKNNDQKFNNYFASLGFYNYLTSASISYYKSDIDNFAIPLLDQGDNASNINEITFFTGNGQFEGLNLNSSLEIWNILLETNINYTLKSILQNIEQREQLFINAGIFYVDTLFNNNLNLKTGIKFYYNDDPNNYVYDFRKMRASYLSISNGVLGSLSMIDVINDQFRIDFYLAGRIQDAATVYFIYENILNNQYFLVPYFPMPEGGIRIGLSWDFLD